MAIRRSTVNFGRRKRGITTVGFTLYNYDDTEKAARSTTNVTELGTSTGVYATTFDVDEFWDGIVLWDTGDSSVEYAQEDREADIVSIRRETDKISKIWNTIQQNADFSGELLMKMAGMQENFEGMPQTALLEKVLKTMKDDLFDNQNSMVELVGGEMVGRMNELNDMMRGIVVIDHTPQINEVMLGLVKIQEAHKDIMAEVKGIEIPEVPEFPPFPEFPAFKKEFSDLGKIKNELSVVIRKLNAFYTDSLREQRGAVTKLRELINSKPDNTLEINTIIDRLDKFFDLEKDIQGVDAKVGNALAAINKVLADVNDKNGQELMRKTEAELKKLRPLLAILKGASNG